MSTEYIEIKPQEDNEYIVTITYLDMPGKYNGDDSLTVRIDLQAKDAVTAMLMATKIDTINKAEIMTDFIPKHPSSKNKDVYTREEIDNLRQQAIDRGAFANWLMFPISAIQVVEASKQQAINELAINEVFEHASHVGNQAEEFLKDIDKGKEGTE